MSARYDELGDYTFLSQFEKLTLPPEHFDHGGHIRLAWLYLSKYDQQTAIIKVCEGIKNYAHSLGATDKFHLTITVALVNLIAKKMKHSATSNFEYFLAGNSELNEDALALLKRHYSSTLLFSEEAQQNWHEPDLSPF